MTQTRPDSTAGTRQAGWIKPPLADRPADRGRGDHQSRPFDRDPPAIRPGDQCSRTIRRRTSPAPRSPSRTPGRTQETLRDSQPRWAVDARWHRPEPTANECPAISTLMVALSPPVAPAISPQLPLVPQRHDFLALGQGKMGVPAHGTSRYPVVAGKHHRIGNPWTHIIHKRCTSNDNSSGLLCSCFLITP